MNKKDQNNKENKKWQHYLGIFGGLGIAIIYGLNYPDLETYDIIVICLGAGFSLFSAFKAKNM